MQLVHNSEYRDLQYKMFLLNDLEILNKNSFLLFTIQNVSIKFPYLKPKMVANTDLQYKMFLLNF